jgi:hypothetical protein
MSEMADVLRDHRILQDVWPPRCFTCGDVMESTEADHKAAALSAAGFGPTQDTGAIALEDAADAIDENPYEDLDPFYAGWLRDRARKIRESDHQ